MLTCNEHISQISYIISVPLIYVLRPNQREEISNTKKRKKAHQNGTSANTDDDMVMKIMYQTVTHYIH